MVPAYVCAPACADVNSKSTISRKKRTFMHTQSPGCIRYLSYMKTILADLVFIIRDQLIDRIPR
jgi:hypothetical protein